MKTRTKLELTVLAIAVFTANESIIQVFGTEDGQIFLDENRANLHAGTFEKKIKVYPISRGDAEQAAKKESKAKDEPVAPKAPKETVKSDKKTDKKIVPAAPIEPAADTTGTEGSETGTTPEPTKEGTESETKK
jgi:hypothetical protein